MCKYISCWVVVGRRRYMAVQYRTLMEAVKRKINSSVRLLLMSVCKYSPLVICA